jgi:hypothetical protein
VSAVITNKIQNLETEIEIPKDTGRTNTYG